MALYLIILMEYESFWGNYAAYLTYMKSTLYKMPGDEAC